MSLRSIIDLRPITLRLHDPTYFCEKLDLYIFVLFSFIWSDGDLSS